MNDFITNEQSGMYCNLLNLCMYIYIYYIKFIIGNSILYNKVMIDNVCHIYI